MREQRRGRRLAMAPEECDAFLREQRTARVATASPGGRPHVSPLWFAWDGESLWLHSLVRSQRWTDLQRNPRCAVVVDAGTEYNELRGVELFGEIEAVGEVPRVGETNAQLDAVEALFYGKYANGEVHHDGRHAWLWLRPQRQYSWDFRKIGGS